MKKYSAYLFDLDGTLIETSEMIIECYKHCLKTILNISVSDQVIISSFGQPMADIYPKLTNHICSEAEISKLIEMHKAHQQKIWKNYLGIYDDVQNTLATLRHIPNIKIAIVTSRTRPSTLLYLDHYNIRQYFDVICTYESTVGHKPDPEPVSWTLSQLNVSPSSTIFVGDSPADMKAGKGADTDICYVNWSRLPLTSNDPKPTYTINNISSILPDK